MMMRGSPPLPYTPLWQLITQWSLLSHSGWMKGVLMSVFLHCVILMNIGCSMKKGFSYIQAHLPLSSNHHICLYHLGIYQTLRNTRWMQTVKTDLSHLWRVTGQIPNHQILLLKFQKKGKTLLLSCPCSLYLINTCPVLSCEFSAVYNQYLHFFSLHLIDICLSFSIFFVL